MTRDHFLAAWKKRCIDQNIKFTEQDYVLAPKQGLYLNCPFCIKRSKNKTPDRDHSLSVHPEKSLPGKPVGAYRCFRCQTPLTQGWGMRFLLGKHEKPSTPSPTIIKERFKNPILEVGNVLVPLLGLPRNHIARRILLRDGFTENDIIYLSRKFSLLYCVQGKSFLKGTQTTTNRLIIPIIQQNAKDNIPSIQGWQARWLPPTNQLINENDENQYLKANAQKKYLLSPGFNRSLLYNFSNVIKQSKRIILFEGAKKAWKIPDHGVAQFGISRLGSDIKPWVPQITQFEEIIFCYDRDAESIARQNAKKISSIIDPSKQICSYVKHPPSGPNDIDKYSSTYLKGLIELTLWRARRKADKIQ